MRNLRCKILVLFALLLIGLFSFSKFQNEQELNLHETEEDLNNYLLKTQQKNANVLTDLDNIKRSVKQLNLKQTLHNEDLFGQPPAKGHVIAVQVHSRLDFFKQLLESLKLTRGIEKATLVISMDKYSEELMKLISTIDFCRYITIFFPFSMQLYPDSFPGEHPKDCPRDVSKSKAVKMGCNNALHPDTYGHYREVKYVQTKHHWYWKLHMLFNGINCLHDKDSSVLLLEEDYYVLPDVLHAMDLTIATAEEECPDCNAISLGNYEPKADYKSQSGNARVGGWLSSKNNIGMVITRKYYDVIVSNNDEFCSYDDYNWDWTLQAVTPKPFMGIFLEASRVLHLGTCKGTHVKGGSANCDAEQQARQALEKVDMGSLFPAEIKVTRSSLHVGKPFINGGWGDVRDHELCKSYIGYSKQFLESIFS